MTVAIHGYPKFKFFLPGTNTLAVGAKLFTYGVGTTTKKTSYQNFDKSTANTNPIVLDANGECSLWLDGKYKLVLAPSNDTDPPASPYWTIDSVGDEDLTASVAGISNKIPNGSFEIDTSGNGVPDNWTLTAGTGNTLAVDTATQIHGDTSLKFTIASANTADAITDFFEVQEGVQEIIRFALKASAVDANIIVRLKWYTGAQVFVSNTDVYSDSTTNPTSWADKGFTYTPPSTARYAKLQILVATTGKTVNVDNFRTSPIDDHDVARTLTGLWSFNNGLTQFGSASPSEIWNTSYTAIEIDSTGALTNTGLHTSLAENGYVGTATGTWRYQNTDKTSLVEVGDGHITLFTAPSGTADTVISWNTALKAESDGTVKGLGGNWLISPDGSDITPNAELVVYSAASGAAYIQVQNSTTGTTSTDGVVFGIDANEVSYIWNYENTDLILATNNQKEMYLDASTRGLVIGAPSTDEGKGVGTVNAANGLYDDGVRIPTEKVYGGYANSTGTLKTLPSGWTFNHDSTGKWTITHGLGLSSGSSLAVSLTSHQTASLFGSITSSTINAFTFEMRSDAGTLTDTSFFFIAIEAG